MQNHIIRILVLSIVASALSSCAWYERQVAKQQPHRERTKVVRAPDGERVAIRTKRPDTQPQEIAATQSPKRQASMDVVTNGLEYLQIGDMAAAVQSFQSAATLDGSNGVAYYYLARTHYAMGNTRRAGGILDRAESLLSSSDDWQLRIAAFREELSMSSSI